MTTDPGQRPRAFVLGGGVAGLTAAFGLADRGYEVTLLESRRFVGGRAFSTPDATSGERLDNGFHVMLGCYRAMRGLLRRLGTEQRFRQDRRLTMAYRFAGGASTRLELSRLPVPLAMPWALLRLGIGLGARLRALRGMVSSLRGAPEHWSLQHWLDRRGQGGLPDGMMWRPLCRAVMNVEPEHCSAADFLATLREAFSGSAAAAAFWVPLAGWGELIGDPAPAALARAGVALRTGARVVGIERRSGAIVGLALGDGERIDVAPQDVVVSALPWFALGRLVDPQALGPAGSLQSAPIVTAYFVLPDDAVPPPDDGAVTALVDGAPFHFVLRRPGDDVRRFALLSGGDRSFDGMQVDAIVATAKRQLAAFCPGVGLDEAVVRVRKEQHATFVAAPGSARVRPEPGRLPRVADNLWVCGDWTATGLPATLEGAARSAELLLTKLPARR